MSQRTPFLKLHNKLLGRGILFQVNKDMSRTATAGVTVQIRDVHMLTFENITDLQRIIEDCVSDMLKLRPKTPATGYGAAIPGLLALYKAYMDYLEWATVEDSAKVRFSLLELD